LDHDEFTAMYAQHFAFVWRCLRALGVPEPARDDAAQEVFVVVHRRLAEFRGASSLRTWVYGIVRNVAANQRRRERRRPASPLQDEPECSAPGPHERAQDSDAARFVQAFVAGLGEKKRDVFVLALIEQMSMPEVAEALAIPLNTAYTRLRDARIEFRRALAARGDKP
jgi:RNA polymerase sigma-70 factor, ECF subfamily